MPNPTEPTSIFYLAAPRTEFTPALTLGHGLPRERNGLPCFYYWGDALPVGDYVHPTKGFKLPVDRKRQDALIRTFSLMTSRGVGVPIVTDHKELAANTLGYVVDMKRSGDRLMELCQFLGEESRDIGLKNHISVGIDPDFVDGEGNKYGEAIRHSAATPVPVVPNQQGFIAASRGQANEAIILELAANSNSGHPTKDGADMKLSATTVAAMRKCMGLSDSESMEDDEDKAMSRLLSYCDNLKGKTLSAQVDAAKVIELSAAVSDRDKKITDLSKPAPSADVIAERKVGRPALVELSMQTGDMHEAIGTQLLADLKKEKTDMFLLSAADGQQTPIDYILSLFKGKKLGTGTGTRSGVQALSREVPDDGNAPAFDPSKDEQFKLMKNLSAAYSPAK